LLWKCNNFSFKMVNRIRCFKSCDRSKKPARTTSALIFCRSHVLCRPVHNVTSFRRIHTRVIKWRRNPFDGFVQRHRGVLSFGKIVWSVFKSCCTGATQTHIKGLVFQGAVASS
jgi:hypothetical protein